MRLISMFIAVAAAALGGCASTLQNHYTLDMRPSPSAGDGALTARHFTVADSLAARNLAIKTGPTTIEHYAAAQWAGSLQELMREKFQAEFAGAEGVSRAEARVVDGSVLAFEQHDLPGGAAQAQARIGIQIHESGQSRYAPPLFSKVYEASAPMDAVTPEALSVALSRCVEIIAARVRADAAGL